MTKQIALFFVLFFCGNYIQAQDLPSEIRSYLNKNYKDWKLSPTDENCAAGFTIEGFVISDFNGDEKPDYTVKFTRGKKGYLLAFLRQKSDFKAFVLHKTVRDI